MSDPRGIGPVGTGLRLCFGGLALLVAFLSNPTGLELAVGLVGYPVAEPVLVRLFRGPGSEPFKLYGWKGYALNYGITVALWLVWTVPALLFFGVSLLLSGVQGYAGCEILALSNLLRGRNDELACAILSPIDNIERSATASG